MEALLGHGAQYKVYDLGDRVKKVPNTFEEAVAVLLRWGYSRIETTQEIEQRAIELLKQRDQAVQFFRQRSIDLSLLGNPVFQEDGSYLQDRVTALGAYLHDASKGDDVSQSGLVSRAHSIIDRYIDALYAHWNNGFADIVYNVTANNGVTDDGHVILFDFGEMAFSKERVAHDIHEERWTRSWSFTRDKNLKGVKGYYAQQMAQRVTLEQFEHYWHDAPLSV